MESKTSETEGAQAVSETGGAGATPEEADDAAQAAGSCCVLEEVVREGRVVTVCVATCCGAAATDV